ncbi:MAG: hypothetical protein INR64_00965 [Caulobacteraceae bacterium]|nr:hypothetical protein [Caulobacter sp.]
MAMTLEDAERVFGRSHGRLNHRDFERGRAKGPLPLWAPVAAAAAVGLVSGALLLGGRRLAHQAGHTLPGDWLERLAAEKRLTDALLDDGADTHDDEPMKRGALLARVAYLLVRQSLQKEGVVYPALRSEGNGGAAKSLASDQFDIKAALFDLWEGDRADPRWGKAWRALRKLVDQLGAEEAKVLPDFHAKLTPKANARIMRAINREGDRLA